MIGQSALMDSHGNERSAAIALVVAQLIEWCDVDEPMVEAIGTTLAEVRRLDSQEQARRVLNTVIAVLEREASAS